MKGEIDGTKLLSLWTDCKERDREGIDLGFTVSFMVTMPGTPRPSSHHQPVAPSGGKSISEPDVAYHSARGLSGFLLCALTVTCPTDQKEFFL